MRRPPQRQIARVRRSGAWFNHSARRGINAISSPDAGRLAMGSTWEGKVFRLRNLPSDIQTRIDVCTLVSTALRVPANHVSVCSLATTCDKWEVPPSKVATVQLRSAPRFPPNVISDEEWSFARPGLGPDEGSLLLLDTHFRGLTVLNDPKPGKHEAEYVPVRTDPMADGDTWIDCPVLLAALPFRVWQVTQSGPGSLAETGPSCGSGTRCPKLFPRSGLSSMVMTQNCPRATLSNPSAIWPTVSSGAFEPAAGTCQRRNHFSSWPTVSEALYSKKPSFNSPTLGIEGCRRFSTGFQAQ